MQVLRAFGSSVVFIAVIAALVLGPTLLIPGASWRWPSGWAFLAIYGGLAMVGNVGLALFRPESLKVRQQGFVANKAKKQPLADAVGLIVFVGYLAVWMAFIPFDVFRLHLLPRPAPWLSAVGGVAVAVGVIFGFLAVAQNRFAAPTVQDQIEDGQTVIDSGPYALVRHPLYTGNLLAFSGMALLLGSYAALIGVGVILAFTFARIAIEERWLFANLDGYADYAARVRSRLIPFLV